jgi:LexA-binding, inner membrane-associated putative hydrolase
MHIQTHVMSGWCIGNLFKLNRRERFFCLLAASLPDMDGVTIIAGWGFYQDWHHVLAHNILFCVILAAVLTGFSESKLKTFVLYLGLMALHMVMDLFGSGEGWYLYLYWPFSMEKFYTNYGWAFFSWQNQLAGFLFLLWTLAIIYCQKRTPLEYIMPKLDHQLVVFFLKISRINNRCRDEK